MRGWILSALVVLASPGAAPGEDASGLEARGDAAFARRAAGGTAVWAARAPIAEAVDAYRRAVAADPDDLGLRIKLLEAVFFEAEYARRDEGERKAMFERGRELFEESFELLARRAGRRSLRGVDADRLPELLADVPEAGALYFWGSVHWGLWAQYFGKLQAVRKGVAKKIRELGEGALALDPDVEEAGPLRLLGRLHHLTPKIVFITGWIDRDRVVPLLSRAVERAPRDPLNRVFLAEAVWELEGDPARARRMMEEVAEWPARPERLLEDRRAIGEAQDLLRRLNEHLR